MNKANVTIGLDSADPDLFGTWMDQGKLPNLARMRDSGSYMPIEYEYLSPAETTWTTVLTGMPPNKTGFWSPLRFNAENGEVIEVGSYDYESYRPFYALCNGLRVAAVDIPQARVCDGVNGIQVLGYGAHSQQGPRCSHPQELLPQLIKTYGDHPAFERDYAWLWRPGMLETLTERLVAGARVRGNICVDMIRDQRWDLFFTVFGEFHSAGHWLWHISQPDHPFHEIHKDIIGKDRDPMLEVAQAIDEAVGAIVDAMPPDTTVLIFSQEGMVTNNLDLTSMLMLPEMLYRHSFPGSGGLVGNPKGENDNPPPLITNSRSYSWPRAVMGYKHESNSLLRFIRRYMPTEVPYLIDKVLRRESGPQYYRKFDPHWMSPLWYSPYWPQMAAFALPSFSDGLIRINLKGRDRNGHVDPADFGAYCDELTTYVMNLKNARTGKPVAKQVFRSSEMFDSKERSTPDADLVVRWDEDPADVVDSPEFGRIGPLPFMRTGGHSTNGFAIANGPDVRQQYLESSGDLVDIAPTLFGLLGISMPAHFEGIDLLKQ